MNAQTHLYTQRNGVNIYATIPTYYRSDQLTVNEQINRSFGYLVPSRFLWYWSKNNKYKIPMICTDIKFFTYDVSNWQPMVQQITNYNYTFDDDTHTTDLPENHPYLNGILTTTPIITPFIEIGGKEYRENHRPYVVNPHIVGFERLFNLTRHGTPEMIQEYLNEMGVFQFTGEQIVYLPMYKKYFALTRFYLPRNVAKNLYAEYISFKAYPLIKVNRLGREILKVFPNFPDDQIDRLSPIIQSIAGYIHQGNEQAIYTSLDTTHHNWVIHDPQRYLKLYLVNRQPFTRDSLNHIEDYTDNQLEQFFGPFNERFTSRYMFIYAIIHSLNNRTVRYMSPQQALFCLPGTQEDLYTEPFADKDELYIGIGSFAQGFRCYTYDNLLRTFTENNRPADPYDIHNLTFDEQTLTRIRILYANTPLATLIEEFSRNQVVQHSEIQPIVRDYPQLTEDIFMELFYLGMYLRRWLGPGNPYPITEIVREGEGETMTTDIGLRTATNATICGAHLWELIQQLPQNYQRFITNLPIIVKAGNTFDPTNKTIGGLIRLVGQADACIRMASGDLALTGAYYLHIYFNKQPPNFNLRTNSIAWH